MFIRHAARLNACHLGLENMSELLKELSGRTADTSNESTVLRIENTTVRKIDMMWLKKR